MPADAGIYGMIQQPKPVNRLADYAQALQIRGLQQEGQMNQLKMDEYQRGVADQNALRDALSAPGADVSNALLKLGKVKEATDYQKGQADVAKTGAETDAKKFEVASKRMDVMGQTLGFVRQNPSVENATQAIQYLVQNNIMPPEKGQEALAKFNADPSPQAIAAFAEMGFRAALQAKDQLAKTQTNNIGGQTVTQQIDPVTGKATLASAIQNTQSPDAILQSQTSEANNKRTVAAQYDLNKATREAAQSQATATREAAQIRRDQDTEMKLADDYRAQSKPFKEVSDAYRIITTSLDKATTSPAATLAGATKFMKLLDPGSVVRESELGMALAATGVLDRATNYYNVLQRGQVLTQKQADDFKNIASQIYQAAQSQQQLIDKDYRTKAETYKLRPDMVVQDLGQNAKPKTAPAAGLPPGWTVETK